MNYTYTRENDEGTAVFEINAQEWDNYIEKAYQRNKSKYMIPGFRKGHTPRKVLEKTYGEGVFFDDAFNIGFQDMFDVFLDKEPDVFPIDRPDVNLDDMSDTGLKITAKFPLKPVVKLGDLTKIEVAKTPVSVSDEEVRPELKKATERAARKVTVTDRAVENGDFVSLDYSGSVDGEKFAGGTAENQELEIGSHSFIEGFEEQLIGLNIGDEKDINVTFPAEYHAEELKGKPAVFAVKIHEIKVKEYPKLDDEFAKDVSEFDTLEEYKADIKKRLTETAEKKAKSELENKLLEAATAQVKLTVPKVLLDQQIDYNIKELEYRLMYQGMKLDDYLKYSGGTMEQLREQYRDNAEKTVKTRLVIEEIVKAENITATDEETDAKIAAEAETAGKTVEEFKKNFDERRISYYHNDIVMDKLIELLKSKAKITSGEAAPKKTAKAKAAK